ncbi:MAG: hypothetical protein RI907_3625 [Pseudomonadota bacterium]|jgi:hypothetical protein
MAFSRILILGWTHPFHTVMEIAVRMGEGFRQQGCVVDVVNARTPDGLQRLGQLVAEGQVDLVVGINPEAFHVRLGDRWLHEVLDATYGVLFIDHPLYLIEKAQCLFELPDDSMFLFLDKGHERLMRRHLDQAHGGRFRCVFWPFAGPAPHLTPLSRVPKSGDICIFASLDQAIMASAMDAEGRLTLADPALNQFLTARLAPLTTAGLMVDAVQITSEIMGLPLDITRTEHVLMFKVIDSYLKRHRRHQLALALVQAASRLGCLVDIYGTGWEVMGALPAGCRIHGPRPYGDQFQVFRESKLLLNLDPNWAWGAHDRVFNAMAMQCGVISNSSRFLDASFDEGREWLQFSQLDQLEGLIAQGLADWQGIVTRATERYAVDHTWKSRAASLLGHLDLVQRARRSRAAEHA